MTQDHHARNGQTPASHRDTSTGQSSAMRVPRDRLREVDHLKAESVGGVEQTVAVSSGTLRVRIPTEATTSSSS